MTKKITLSKQFIQPLLNMKFKLVIMLAAFSIGGLQAQTEVILTTAGAGTWTCPAGVTSMTIECWGAGGAGGSTFFAGTGDILVKHKVVMRAGGGAGGSYSKVVFTNPVAGDFTYTVGAGGIVPTPLTSTAPEILAAAFADNAFVDGGNTIFGENSVVAVGGNGGKSRVTVDATEMLGDGGAKKATGNIGTINFYGGAGASGTTGINAAGGGSAGATGPGGDAAGNVAGAAGPDGGAVGGTPGTGTFSNGGNGVAPGAGGAGANGTPANATANGNLRRGGSGGNGQIKITYTGGTGTGLSSTKANTFVTVEGNNLKLNGEINAIEVFNAQGKLMHSQGNVTSVNNLKNGIYIVKMHTPQGVNIQKVSIR